MHPYRRQAGASRCSQNLWTGLLKTCGQLAARPDRRSSATVARDSYSQAFFKQNSCLRAGLEVPWQLSPWPVDNCVCKLWSPGRQPLPPGRRAGCSKNHQKRRQDSLEASWLLAFTNEGEQPGRRAQARWSCPHDLWNSLWPACGKPGGGWRYPTPCKGPLAAVWKSATG